MPPWCSTRVTTRKRIWPSWITIRCTLWAAWCPPNTPTFSASHARPCGASITRNCRRCGRIEPAKWSSVWNVLSCALGTRNSSRPRREPSPARFASASGNCRAYSWLSPASPKAGQGKEAYRRGSAAPSQGDCSRSSHGGSVRHPGAENQPRLTPPFLPLSRYRLPRAARDAVGQDHPVHRPQRLVRRTDRPGLPRPTPRGGRLPAFEESSLPEFPPHLPLDRSETSGPCLLLCPGTYDAQPAAATARPGGHLLKHRRDHAPLQQHP